VKLTSNESIIHRFQGWGYEIRLSASGENELYEVTRIVEKERLTAKEMSDIRRNIQGMGEKAGLDICYTSFKSKKVTQVSKEGGRAVVEIHNNMAGAVFSKGEQSLPPGVSTKPVFKIHAMC